MSSSSNSRRIAIIGGGLGGLVLLRLLLQHDIPATLYERDSSPNDRAHLGGTLDLHEESGLRALGVAGLLEKFLPLSRPEGEETRIHDSTGALLFHEIPVEGQGPPARPEVDRTVLRKLLLDAVPADSIKWDHAFVSARPVNSDSGEHIITFSNGFETTTDLLVGADGARSRVRLLVSTVPLSYTGLTGAEISLAPQTVAEHQALSGRLGQGTMFAVSQGKSIVAQRNGDNRIRTYAYFPEEEQFTLPTEPDEAKAVLLEKYEGWVPWLRELIELADPIAIYPRPLYALPVGHRWENKAGVTLLGDAAHLMSPWAGEGANVAMQDGLELALALVEAKDPARWRDAIKGFEEEMFARAGRAASESEANLKMSMMPDAAQMFVEQFKSHGPPPE